MAHASFRLGWTSPVIDSFLFRSTVASVLLAVVSPGAHACDLRSAAPTETIPTIPVGQSFTFVATDDCTMLRFSAQNDTVLKTPRPGMAVGTDRHRYSVRLTAAELETLLDPMFTVFQWRITGRDAVTGFGTNLGTTNEIDGDRDGWTRTGGDVGDCDFDPAQNPGEPEVYGNGVDDNCDGQIDNVVFTEPDVTIVAYGAYEELGYAIGDGDVDADGSADLLLASPTPDSRGRIYVAYGPVESDVDVADLFVLQALPGTRYGESVAVGDVDGDGVDDVLSGFDGQSHLFLGPITPHLGPSRADAIFEGAAPSSQAGDDVDVVPDMDGDGLADIVIGNPAGAPTSSGRVYVLSGTTSGGVTVDTEATHTFVGGAEYEDVGDNNFSIGDATGDGIADLAFGAPTADSAIVYLVEGGGPAGTYDLATTAWSAVHPVDGGDSIGTAVAGGDFDGDGAIDLVVSDTLADLSPGSSASGLVYAFRGPLSESVDAVDADAIWFGTERPASLGDALLLEDLDGDDQLDLAMSAPLAGPAGEVYLQLGWSEDTVDVATLPTVVAPSLDAGNSWFGNTMTTVADWTGDDRPEIAIGAPYAYGPPDTRGEAYLFESDTLF